MRSSHMFMKFAYFGGHTNLQNTMTHTAKEKGRALRKRRKKKRKKKRRARNQKRKKRAKRRMKRRKRKRKKRKRKKRKKKRKMKKSQYCQGKRPLMIRLLRFLRINGRMRVFCWNPSWTKLLLFGRNAWKKQRRRERKLQRREERLLKIERRQR